MEARSKNYYPLPSSGIPYITIALSAAFQKPVSLAVGRKLKFALGEFIATVQLRIWDED